MYIENKHLKNYISFWLKIMFCLISLMIVVGGLTRLTDSGLSITQWDLFSGILPPLNQNQWIEYFNLYKQIPEYKIQNYLMTLNEFKIIFWWEWIHRFMGRLVGLLFLLPLIYFNYKIGFKKTQNLYIIFLLICLQGFIGWYMVSSGLVGRIDVSHYRLSLHLLIAFIIISLIYWNYLKINEFKTFKTTLNYFFPLFLIILIFTQICIGAFVSGMDAGKIYNSWPLMGNSYFPDDNILQNLFKISAFNEPSLVQFMHRNLAYLIFFFYIYILIFIFKNKIIIFYKPILLIGLFLIIQILLGIITLVNGAQIIISSMHQISSIFLVSSCIYFLYINTNFLTDSF